MGDAGPVLADSNELIRKTDMLRFNSEIVQRLLMITKLPQVMEVAPDVASGLQLILGHPVELPTRLKFEDRHSASLEKDGGDRKLVVKDSTVDPPQSTHYEVRDVPPSPPERLSILGMAGVVFSALAVLAVLVFGLVWVTKQISSIPLLVLIFCVALLFSLCLLGLVLLLSGHLSERTVGKLLGGVLGKVPGLGSWLPQASKKTKT